MSMESGLSVMGDCQCSYTGICVQAWYSNRAMNTFFKSNVWETKVIDFS